MKVGIVGAGITGLALTHYLAEQGIESVTFEADDEAGGVITSRTVDGHVTEPGPQRMRKTPGVVELAEKAGVGDDIIEASEGKLYVYANGELGEAPITKRQFFTTDLLSVRGKARMLAEPLTRPGTPQETIEEVFVRKFGREAYEHFIGPLYGGIYGSDPAEMPAAFALESLLEREKETKSLLRAFLQRVNQGHSAAPMSFTEGNQQLPNALAETYADRVELSTPVEKIRSEESYVIETADGSEAFDRIVITADAKSTAEMLSPLESDGLVSGLDGLRNLRYNPLAQVFLHADHDYPGKGYQVGYNEELHTLGSSWNANMFDREGAQTVFLGGMHEPEIVDESDETLAEIAREEFEEVVGCEATVIDVARLKPGFPAWDTSWWALEDLELPEGITMATNYTARMGVPSRVREARELAKEFARQADIDGSQQETKVAATS